MNTRTTFQTLAAAAVLALSGCAATTGDLDSDGDLLQGAPEETGTISQELSSGVPLGSTLTTTASLNLRTGASTGYHVRLVIPNGGRVTTINRTTPVNGWYNIKYNGVTGWSYGSYLKLTTSGGGSSGGSSGGGGGGVSSGGLADHTRDGAITRAKSGVGASYWWGHARWYPFNQGGTNSGVGACQGSCPGCSHSGSTGADCSGYVGKIWQVPSSNTSLTNDYHPYSTVNFNASSSQWHTVSRSSAIRADALVYNSNGAGHIFLYESGDGWGSMWAYEAKGCSYGIKHNIRTASSSYKAIRHY